jgi:hypothetical protein
MSASKVVSVVFSDVDICVPAASVWRASLTRRQLFFLRLERWISSRPCDLSGSFSARRWCSTDAAIVSSS